jgi:hypothetical protein
MIDDSLRRGIESYVAAFLREHVAEGLLSRPEIRSALSPEALTRIRTEILERLKRSEAEGMGDRDLVRKGVHALATSLGTAGQEALRNVASWASSQASRGDEPAGAGPGGGA